LFVERDCFVKGDESFGKTVFGKSVPVKTPAQIRFVGLRIVGSAFFQFETLAPVNFGIRIR
jgi:hypothetical protein